MTTKKFLRFQIIILLLLIVSIIGNTFAWANRPAVKGGGFMGTEDTDYAAIELVTPNYNVNGNSCTAVTYRGTLNEETGEIVYDDEVRGSTPVPVENFTDEDLTYDEIYYFKTIITNTAEIKTNVSLFISGYTDNNLTAAFYGVSTPITRSGGFPQSYYDYTDGKRYYKLAPVVTEYEMGPATGTTPATAKIEWFVFFNEKVDSIHHGEFHISDIIFTNN